MKSGTTASDPEVDFIALPAGEMIGRYEILAVLGQGGFGTTYLARDIQLGREVAIKEYLPISLAIRQDGNTVLPRSTKVAEDFTWGRDRFVAEGRTLATLHRAPGIVRVFDFLEINGTAYIVMEMLHGETLEARLKKQGALDPAAIDLVVSTLLDGLEEVHNAGFLHRDIKPANILLDGKGSPTLIDFGASRAAMVGRTVAMTAIFTPGYAAAEQFTSAKQGPWTDIYGLSATLYHAILGAAPPSAFDRMLDDSYEPIAQRAGPGFSAGLLAGIDAGLAIRASDRPQSIAGWRPILSWTAASGDDATVRLDRTRAEPAATTLTPRPATGPVATSPRVESPPPATAKSRVPVYAGIAAAVLALAGGGYFALAPGGKPAAPSVALQDLKVEDLERVLAERRKADAAAAEKKRLEEEAQRKAEADAAAKRTADTELADAQLKRQKAEEELAKLKADMEARRQAEAGQREQASSAARRAAEETAQRKAEAEMAALRQAEDDARKKAAAETETKRQADEALVRAQAERQKAEAEASQKATAEAKQKAEASTKEVAEAEAAAADKKAAEALESGLRLSSPDRQHIQVALTALGFDTRGNDGAFGPRSREMIANWQKARNQPATGFLNGAQNQALLKEAAPAVAKFDDDQKKIEDDKKKAEEEKKKADEEAKARTAAAAVPAATTVAPPAAQGAGPSDGSYGGAANLSTGGTSAAFAMTVQVANGSGTGAFLSPHCGRGPVTIRISPTGDVVGEATGFDRSCGKVSFGLRGRLSGNQLQLNFSAPGTGGSATLTLGAAAPAAIAPAPPAVAKIEDDKKKADEEAKARAASAAVPAATTAAPPAAPGTRSSDGSYGGAANLATGGTSGAIPMTVQVANGVGTGTLRSPNCGQGPISIRISPTGDVSGEATGFDRLCGKLSFGLRGRLAGNQLQLNFSAAGTGGSAVLTLGVAAPAAIAPAPPPVPATPAPAAGAASAVPAAGDVRWIGQAKCGFWNSALPLSIPVTNGQGSVATKGPPEAAVVVTITISGNRYSGSIVWSPRINPSKTLTASFSGTISGNTISASPYARSDFKGGPGPDDVACNVELARTQ
ncbi:MAG: protein kinase [Reyranella sp.]|nr:protein kinase [Reyranella sp.]